MEVQEDDGWADDGEWEEIEEVEEISSGPASVPIPATASTSASDENDKRRKLDPAALGAHTSSTVTAAPAVTSAGADDTGSGKQASHPAAMATALASSSTAHAQQQIAAKKQDPPSPGAMKPAPDHGRDAAAALPATSAAAATVAVGALPPVAERHDTRRIEFVEGESGSVVNFSGLNFRVIPLQAIRIPGSERYRA